MSARILAFPAPSSLPTIPTAHLPLIDLAISLARSDDVDFEKRCELIVQTEGMSVLRRLVLHFDRLCAHLTEIVEALSIASTRIHAQVGGADA